MVVPDRHDTNYFYVVLLIRKDVDFQLVHSH